MGFRIRTNVASLVGQRHLQDNTAAMNQSLERLSSGYRINRSADDAAGLAVSESLRAKVRGLNMAKRNANDAVSMVQIAEGSMNEISNIMIRMRELTVQSASDTVGNTERGYLNREYTNLVDEVDRIANTTEFNNIMLFQAPQEQFVIQVGTTNGAPAGYEDKIPKDNSNTISISLNGLKFNSKDLGLSNQAEIGPTPSDPGESPSREQIAEKLDTIDAALNRMASERATLGSIQSRLGSAMNNLSISTENMATANSRIRDVDFASETSQLTQMRVLTQSSTAVLTQANAAPEMALQLLRQ